MEEITSRGPIVLELDDMKGHFWYIAPVLGTVYTSLNVVKAALKEDGYKCFILLKAPATEQAMMPIYPYRPLPILAFLQTAFGLEKVQEWTEKLYILGWVEH